jgi:molybdopterin molybdotransferase
LVHGERCCFLLGLILTLGFEFAAIISCMAADPQEPVVPSFEVARHMVEEHAERLRPRIKELVKLLDSGGRILAENVAADRNFPPFRRAARDGYAVRGADLTELPARLAVIGEIKAGAVPESIPELQSGQAAAIMTGAPTPTGADSVVMIEHTSRDGDRVEITKGVAAGDNVVAVGSEAKRGDRVLAQGMRLDYAAISVAASVGRMHLLVYAKPQVAVLATGDEIVDIDLQPGPSQIRNSNTYSLAAQIRAAGGEPILLPIAPDEPKRLRELISDGLEADLLVLAGGVSMGKYDLAEQVLGEFRTEFFFTGAQIQPGKPVVFGRIACGPDRGDREPRGDAPTAQSFKYFFGLPGNPVSTMVTFELFVRPLLEALAGRPPSKLVFLHAKLKSEIKTKTGLRRFLPATLSGEFEAAEVDLAPWHGSGDIAAMALANCYVVIPPDRESIPAGEWVALVLR